MTGRVVTACVGILLLGGCAGGPAIQEWGDGRLPPGPRTYHIDIDAVEPRGQSQAVAAVRNALRSKGWREMDGQDSWTVEVTYSVRPMQVGAFSDESAEKEAWVLKPALPQWWTRDRDLHVLHLALARPGDGRDISVGAARRESGPVRPDLLQDLARSAVSRLH